MTDLKSRSTQNPQAKNGENIRAVIQGLVPLFEAEVKGYNEGFNDGYDKGYADALSELSVNLNEESAPTQVFELKRMPNED